MGRILSNVKNVLLKAVGYVFPISDVNLDDKCIYQILRGEGDFMITLRQWAETRLVEAMRELNPEFAIGTKARTLFDKVTWNAIPYDRPTKALEATLIDPRSPCRTLAWILLAFDDVTVDEFADLIKVADRLDSETADIGGRIQEPWGTTGSYRFKLTFGFDYIDSRAWKSIRERVEATEGVL